MITTVYAVALLIGLVVQLTNATTTTHRDNAYYPAGTYNPLVNNDMYWRDAKNILEDLSMFESLHVKYEGCVWSPASLDYSYSNYNNDNDNDNNNNQNNGSNDVWYSGIVPREEANVAFTLYGKLKSNKGRGSNGCNSQHFINSFYTATGLDTFLQSMATARVQRFDKYSSSGSAYLSAYSGTCNDGYGVSCTDKGNFAVFKYGTSELASQSTCHADTRQSVTENLQQLNSDLHAGAKCVEIYNDSIQGSSIDTSDVTGTAISLLSYSMACTLGDPAKGCPDPYAKLKFNEKTYKRAATLRNKTRDFRIRIFKSFCLLAFGVVMIFFAFRIYKREEDYVEYDKSLFQRYFKAAPNHDPTLDSSLHKSKNETSSTITKKNSKKKGSSRSKSPAADRRNRDRSQMKPERNDRSKPQPDDADGGYYVAMEAGVAPSIKSVSSIRTSEGKEEIYDGPAFDEVAQKSVMILDLDYEIESAHETDLYDEEEDDEEDDDDYDDDLEKVTGVSPMNNRRQGILSRPKRRDEAPWSVFEAAMRRITMRRRKRKGDNFDKSDPLLESERASEIQMISVKTDGCENDPIDPAAISTHTRSAKVTKRNNVITRIGRWMKHNNREREKGVDENHQTMQVGVDKMEESAITETEIEQRTIPVEELIAQDVEKSNSEYIPESVAVEDQVACAVVESDPIKIPVEEQVDRDMVLPESNLESLVDNRTTINGALLPNTAVPIASIVDGAAVSDASGNFKSIETEKETEKAEQPVASAISKESNLSNGSNIWGGLDSGKSCESAVTNIAKITSEEVQLEDAFEKEKPEDRQSGSALVTVGAVAALATTAIGMQQASKVVMNTAKLSGEAEDIALQRKEASKTATKTTKSSGEAGDIATQRQQESKTATKTRKSSDEAGDIATQRQQESKTATSITKSSGEARDIAAQRQQESKTATSITKSSGVAGDITVARQEASKAATSITKSSGKAGEFGAQRSPAEPLMAETVDIEIGSLKSKGSGVETAPVMSDEHDTDSDTDTDTDSEPEPEPEPDVVSTDRDISSASFTVSCAGSFQESTDSHESRNAIGKQWLEQRSKREDATKERKGYSITASDVSYAPSLDESYREEPVKSSYVVILPPNVPIPASSMRSVQSIEEVNVNIPVASEEIELRGNVCQPPFCRDSSSEDSHKTGQNQNAPENVTRMNDDREDASQFLFQSSFHRDSSDNSDNAAPIQTEQSTNSTIFAPLSGLKKFLYPRKGETDMAVTSKVKGSNEFKEETSARSYIAKLTVDPEISPEIDTDEFNQPTPKTDHVTRRETLRQDYSYESSERNIATAKNTAQSIDPISTSRNAVNDKVLINDDITTDVTLTNSFTSNDFPTSSWSVASPFKGLAIAIASADAAEAEWNATKIQELMSIPEQEVDEEIISADDCRTPIQNDMERSQYGGDLLNALEDALSPNASFDADRVLPANTSSITDGDGEAPLLTGLFQNSTDFFESALAMMPKMLSRVPSALSTPPNPVSPRRASFTVFQRTKNDNDDNDGDRSHQTSPDNFQTGFANDIDDDAIPGVEVEIDEELSHAPPVREIRRTGSNDVMSLISYEYSYQTDDDNSTLRSKVRSRVHDERDTHENDERKMTTNKNMNAVNESREAAEVSGGGMDTTHDVNNEAPTVSSSKPPLYKSKSIFSKIGFGRKSRA